MSKSFFEVFPTLKLDAKTKEIMEQTVVDKVSTTRKQDFIRVYISSKNLIDKADILKAETGIKKQFFGNQDLTVKIYEKFSLSAQYTPKNLIDIYKDSILLQQSNSLFTQIQLEESLLPAVTSSCIVSSLFYYCLP
jgi:DNA polymerase-3 subunit alpha (Gram-positive type)